MNTTQRGFSLIELMVSITLGLILLAGVLSIFFSTKVTFLTNEKTARLQENGRTALDFLSHDIRSAGYMGCARSVPFTSTLATPTSVLWNYSIPVQGFESDNAGAYTPAVGITLSPVAKNSSDVLVLRTLSRDGRAARAGAVSPTGTFTVAATTVAPVAIGSVAMITDCNASSVFQVTNWDSATGTITHTAAGSNPGNASADLGYTYQPGARVASLQTYLYYVGTDTVTNEPGLYRKSGAAAPELIIDGVEAFQVAYGEDTNGDRIADRYVAANTVTNWDRVLSVTLSMLIRSEQSGTNYDANTYQLLPAGVGGRSFGPFNDRRQRMVFTTTIALRNRAM